MPKSRRVRRVIHPPITDRALERLAQAVDRIANASDRLTQAAQRLEDAARLQQESNRPMPSLSCGKKTEEQASNQGIAPRSRSTTPPIVVTSESAPTECLPRRSAIENGGTRRTVPLEPMPLMQQTDRTTVAPEHEEKRGIIITVRKNEDGTHEFDMSEWNAYHEQFKDNPNAQVNPAWVSFFCGAIEARKLIAKRREASAACTSLWQAAEKNDELKGIHPGVLLRRDFLGHPGIDRPYLSYVLELSRAKTEQFLAGEIGVTPKMSERLTVFFSLPAEWWRSLQRSHDESAVISP